MKKALLMLMLSVVLCLTAVLCVSAADMGDGYIAWDFSNPNHVADWHKTANTIYNTTNEGTQFGETIGYFSSSDKQGGWINGGIKAANNLNMSWTPSTTVALANYPYIVYKYSGATHTVGGQLYHWNDASDGNPYVTFSVVKNVSKNVVILKPTAPSATWKGNLTKLRLDPMRTVAANATINVVMLGVFKDESTYNQYCVDTVADRFSGYTSIKAADADSALAQAKALADKLETEVYGDGMVITVSEENTAFGNGEFKFAITAQQGGKTANGNVTLKLYEASPYVILNFDNPVMLKAMHTTGATKELVTNSAADAGEYGLLGENVALLTKFTDADNAKTEFNFYVNPGDGVIPVIEELSDYPIILYSYKPSASGTNQVYYYTNGYTSPPHAYLQFVSGLGTDNGFEIGKWANKTLNTSNNQRVTGSAVAGDDYSWSNKPSKLRFDFMKSSYTHITDQQSVTSSDIYIQDGTTVAIDYIGFFKTIEEAKAFAANPTLDAPATRTELETKYADVLEVANSLNCGIDLSMYDADTNGALSEAEIKAFIKTQMTDNGVTDDYYVIISENIAPVAATPDNPNGTNGRFKFTVYVSDAINNGNYAASEEITVHVYADPLFDIQMLGVQYRADGTPGLRFGTQVSFSKVFTDKFTAAGVTDVTYGTLIVPLDAYNKENISLTHAGIGDDGMIGGYEVSDKVKVTADTGKIMTDGSGTFVYTAVVVGIPAGHENVMLSARSYVKYTYGGQTYYCYASPIERCVSNAQNQAENWK